MSDLLNIPAGNRFAAADVYEKLTGGWPARIAKRLVSSLPVPITADSVILDNCCGSGAVTTAIINYSKENGFIPKINSTDISPGMVEHVAGMYKDVPEVQTKIMDAQALQFPDNTFTHVICQFGVFFCPDYELGYREMYRVAAPGSATAITSWQVVGWLPMVNYIIKKVRPEQEEWKFPAPVGFKDKVFVKERFDVAGWKDVTVVEVEDFTAATDETAAALLPLLTDAVGDWTDEEKARFCELFPEAAEACGAEKTAEGWNIKMVALAVTGTK
ncbi:hypothetical protein H072_6291 [Dactylellina haptotyla CBS 200.50]|uniref:Uncharacterized protein n=1 Tax=Dactylellina haptotyla (strain CBS 200.50) TaxID=1284197 RepID=S8BXD0_DACHA|nr:hypothetical protein H072_6291 [Dactylellina haptotyla CBS 200.50]